MSRLARVWAIAVQDWRIVLGGSGWLRLPSLAVAILLPAAALKLPRAPIGPQPERPPIAVSGPVPFALQGVVSEDESSRRASWRRTDPRRRSDSRRPRRGLDRNLGSPTVQVRLTAPDVGAIRPVFVLPRHLAPCTGPPVRVASGRAIGANAWR
jgi:hypothetical protein